MKTVAIISQKGGGFNLFRVHAALANSSTRRAIGRLTP